MYIVHICVICQQTKMNIIIITLNYIFAVTCSQFLWLIYNITWSPSITISKTMQGKCTRRSHSMIWIFPWQWPPQSWSDFTVGLINAITSKFRMPELVIPILTFSIMLHLDTGVVCGAPPLSRLTIRPW